MDPEGGWVIVDFTSLTDFIPCNLHRFVQRSFHIVKTPEEREIREPVIGHSTSDSQLTVTLKLLQETPCEVVSENFRLPTGSGFDEVRLTWRQNTQM